MNWKRTPGSTAARVVPSASTFSPKEVPHVSQPASAARVSAVRSSFAGASAGPYLDVSARSLLYGGARSALQSYLDANAEGRLNKSEMFAAVETTRALYARLIGADADEIAYTRNVTDCISTFAASLPWQ